jgi:hypothetical protein
MFVLVYFIIVHETFRLHYISLIKMDYDSQYNQLQAKTLEQQ